MIFEAKFVVRDVCETNVVSYWLQAPDSNQALAAAQAEIGSHPIIKRMVKPVQIYIAGFKPIENTENVTLVIV